MAPHSDAVAAGLRVLAPREVQAILAELRGRLERLYGSRLRGLYLYGSYARDEAVPGSDLDVLAVLEGLGSQWAEIKRTSEINAELSLRHDVPISLLFTSETRWQRADEPFYATIRREGRAA